MPDSARGLVATSARALLVVVILLCGVAACTDDTGAQSESAVAAAGNLNQELAKALPANSEFDRVVVEGCVLTIRLTYETQCHPNEGVGLAGKDTVLYLNEFRPDVSLRKGTIEPDLFYLELEPTPRYQSIFMAADEAERQIIMSRHSMSPDEQQAFLSTQTEQFLSSEGARSRTFTKTCAGALFPSAPGQHETVIRVLRDRSEAARKSLDEYIGHYCQ